MKINLQQAYILHLRRYRETSALIDLFTLESGRVTVIARGCRGHKAKQKGLYQPFVPLLVSYAGKTDLQNLRSIEGSGPPLYLTSHALLSALYLNELLVKLLHRLEPYASTFEKYQNTLQGLAEGSGHEKLLRLFEKALLKDLGYALQLEHDSQSKEALHEDANYRFIEEEGFVKVADSIQPGISRGFSGKSLLALANETLDDEDVLRDAKRLMRLAFAPLLGNKQIKTRELFL